ncbi:MAG TPA: G1 family glutamic endopeptidase [Bryobacteraceae bacterium]|nr:G1 family glutamic endopeptidase [Bryobacteraceae bacterium]
MNNSSWNAYAVTGPNGYFKLNSSWVASSWDEPGIGTEFCAYGPFIAGQWVGLDGLNDNDVLQAGVSVSGCPTAYVAWYEWYTLGCTSNEAGCSQTNLDIPINVNDEVNVEVWYTTAAPNGHAYIWDQTTQQSVSVGFNQPSGDPGSGYAGNSAEVVVERPLTYSGLANLANYTPFYMQGCAVDSYACGGNPAWTNYNVTMTCPPWNPSNWCPSGGANLSVVNLNTESWLLYFTPGGPTLQ